MPRDARPPDNIAHKRNIFRRLSDLIRPKVKSNSSKKTIAAVTDKKQEKEQIVSKPTKEGKAAMNSDNLMTSDNFSLRNPESRASAATAPGAPREQGRRSVNSMKMSESMRTNSASDFDKAKHESGSSTSGFHRINDDDEDTGFHIQTAQAGRAKMAESSQERQDRATLKQVQRSPFAQHPTSSKSRSSEVCVTCTNCLVTETPLWRKDENDNILCHSCALYRQWKGVSRPTQAVAQADASVDYLKENDRTKRKLTPMTMLSPSRGATKSHKQIQHGEDLQWEASVARHDSTQHDRGGPSVPWPGEYYQTPLAESSERKTQVQSGSALRGSTSDLSCSSTLNALGGQSTHGAGFYEQGLPLNEHSDENRGRSLKRHEATQRYSGRSRSHAPSRRDRSGRNSVELFHDSALDNILHDFTHHDFANVNDFTNANVANQKRRTIRQKQKQDTVIEDIIQQIPRAHELTQVLREEDYVHSQQHFKLLKSASTGDLDLMGRGRGGRHSLYTHIDSDGTKHSHSISGDLLHTESRPLHGKHTIETDTLFNEFPMYGLPKPAIRPASHATEYGEFGRRYDSEGRLVSINNESVYRAPDRKGSKGKTGGRIVSANSIQGAQTSYRDEKSEEGYPQSIPADDEGDEMPPSIARARRPGTGSQQPVRGTKSKIPLATSRMKGLFHKSIGHPGRTASGTQGNAAPQHHSSDLDEGLSHANAFSTPKPLGSRAYGGGHESNQNQEQDRSSGFLKRATTNTVHSIELSTPRTPLSPSLGRNAGPQSGENAFLGGKPYKKLLDRAVLDRSRSSATPSTTRSLRSTFEHQNPTSTPSGSFLGDTLAPSVTPGQGLAQSRRRRESKKFKGSPLILNPRNSAEVENSLINTVPSLTPVAQRTGPAEASNYTKGSASKRMTPQRAEDIVIESLFPPEKERLLAEAGAIKTEDLSTMTKPRRKSLLRMQLSPVEESQRPVPESRQSRPSQKRMSLAPQSEESSKPMPEPLKRAKSSKMSPAAQTIRPVESFSSSATKDDSSKCGPLPGIKQEKGSTEKPQKLVKRSKVDHYPQTLSMDLVQVEKEEEERPTPSERSSTLGLLSASRRRPMGRRTAYEYEEYTEDYTEGDTIHSAATESPNGEATFFRPASLHELPSGETGTPSGDNGIPFADLFRPVPPANAECPSPSASQEISPAISDRTIRVGDTRKLPEAVVKNRTSGSTTSPYMKAIPHPSTTNPAGGSATSEEKERIYRDHGFQKGIKPGIPVIHSAGTWIKKQPKPDELLVPEPLEPLPKIYKQNDLVFNRQGKEAKAGTSRTGYELWVADLPAGMRPDVPPPQMKQRQPRVRLIDAKRKAKYDPKPITRASQMDIRELPDHEREQKICLARAIKTQLPPQTQVEQKNLLDLGPIFAPPKRAYRRSVSSQASSINEDLQERPRSYYAPESEDLVLLMAEQVEIEEEGSGDDAGDDAYSLWNIQRFAPEPVGRDAKGVVKDDVPSYPSYYEFARMMGWENIPRGAFTHDPGLKSLTIREAQSSSMAVHPDVNVQSLYTNFTSSGPYSGINQTQMIQPVPAPAAGDERSNDVERLEETPRTHATAKLARHFPNWTEHDNEVVLPSLLRIPATIRFQIYQNLYSPVDAPPVLLSPPNTAWYYWPGDAFIDTSTVFDGICTPMQTCRQLHAELLSYYLTQFKFHIILNFRLMPSIAPKLFHWVPLFVHRMEDLTIELDFTKGGGDYKDGCGLRPNGEKELRWLLKMVIEPMAKRDTPIKKLHIMVRRYEGCRPSAQLVPKDALNIEDPLESDQETDRREWDFNLEWNHRKRRYGSRLGRPAARKFSIFQSSPAIRNFSMDMPNPNRKPVVGQGGYHASAVRRLSDFQSPRSLTSPRPGTQPASPPSPSATPQRVDALSWAKVAHDQPPRTRTTSDSDTRVSTPLMPSTPPSPSPMLEPKCEPSWVSKPAGEVSSAEELSVQPPKSHTSPNSGSQESTPSPPSTILKPGRKVSLTDDVRDSANTSNSAARSARPPRRSTAPRQPSGLGIYMKTASPDTSDQESNSRNAPNVGPSNQLYRPSPGGNTTSTPAVEEEGLGSRHIRDPPSGTPNTLASAGSTPVLGRSPAMPMLSNMSTSPDVNGKDINGTPVITYDRRRVPFPTFEELGISADITKMPRLIDALSRAEAWSHDVAKAVPDGRFSRFEVSQKGLGKNEDDIDEQRFVLDDDEAEKLALDIARFKKREASRGKDEQTILINVGKRHVAKHAMERRKFNDHLQNKMLEALRRVHPDEIPPITYSRDKFGRRIVTTGEIQQKKPGILSVPYCRHELTKMLDILVDHLARPHGAGVLILRLSGFPRAYTLAMAKKIVGSPLSHRAAPKRAWPKKSDGLITPGVPMISIKMPSGMAQASEAPRLPTGDVENREGNGGGQGLKDESMAQKVSEDSLPQSKGPIVKPVAGQGLVSDDLSIDEILAQLEDLAKKRRLREAMQPEREA